MRRIIHLREMQRDCDIKDVGYMCNLGEGIEERAVERIIMNMHRNDFTLDQIAVATNKTKAEVEQIIQDNELVMA